MSIAPAGVGDGLAVTVKFVAVADAMDAVTVLTDARPVAMAAFDPVIVRDPVIVA